MRRAFLRTLQNEGRLWTVGGIAGSHRARCGRCGSQWCWPSASAERRPAALADRGPAARRRARRRDRRLARARDTSAGDEVRALPSMSSASSDAATRRGADRRLGRALRWRFASPPRPRSQPRFGVDRPLVSRYPHHSGARSRRDPASYARQRRRVERGGRVRPVGTRRRLGGRAVGRDRARRGRDPDDARARLGSILYFLGQRTNAVRWHTAAAGLTGCFVPRRRLRGNRARPARLAPNDPQRRNRFVRCGV